MLELRSENGELRILIEFNKIEIHSFVLVLLLCALLLLFSTWIEYNVRRNAIRFSAESARLTTRDKRRLESHMYMYTRSAFVLSTDQIDSLGRSPGIGSS